jgi:molybdate/tungstate transport system substrate-binding protein
MKFARRIVRIFVVVLISMFIFACGKKSAKSNETANTRKLSGKLIVFHAGSLSVPLKKITAEFNNAYPDVEVLLEGGGSRTCARKISDLKKPCDVMASADYTVINKLLIPKYADWNIRFATNEMAIVYHDTSRKSKEINTENWYKILLDENVAFGRSDPNADPCGYRAVLTAKLAEKFYKKNNLASELLNKDKKYVRPKETDLLALLEAGAIDYIFLYRSVAEQHGLKYVILPNEINLKSAKFADFYNKVEVKISGKKPGKFITKKGAPMVYGITIPKNAPNKKAALVFLEFILSKNKGMKILEKLGQPSAVPSQSNTFNKIPMELKKFAEK